ncbi:hypothetical protein [Ralstonia sp. NFACC01]|uniref:hypothetical protein n=1 Tax=unclassified Ralstonia TaxID=209769 RepID=UPI00158794AD|nr:hypothetical protein [Ralstonia sp. NFACC01]
MRDSLPAQWRAKWTHHGKIPGLRGRHGSIDVGHRARTVSLIVDPFAPFSNVRRGDLSFCHDCT